MKVIVDTSVWFLFLRHKQSDQPSVEVLKSLISSRKVQMLGVVRQELLSGIKSELRFEKLLNSLDGYPSLLPSEENYTVAAHFYNMCRAKGVQGSGADFLICAQSVSSDLPILTTDKDFLYYADHLPIKLYGLEQ